MANKDDFDSVIFGSSLPSTITEALPIIAQLDVEKLKLFLKFVSTYLKGRTLTHDDFLGLQQRVELPEDQCGKVIMGLMTVMRLSIKRKFKNDVLVKEWTVLGLQKPFVEVLLGEVNVW